MDETLQTKIEILWAVISLQLIKKNKNKKIKNKAVIPPPKKKEREIMGFLGNSVIKNPPANAGDKGSIPSLCCGETMPMCHNH